MNLQPASLPAWHGKLNLVLNLKGDKTWVQHCHAQAPFKFQRPFYPEGSGICHGVMLHTAGGIAGGDRLSTSVQLGDSAHGLLTTAAAAKVYRSLGDTSIQTTNITLGDHARLEWFPQETIVFNQAKYHQHTQVMLNPGATWIGWDIARLGRSARGEKFDAGDWRSHIEVWRSHQPSAYPLWIDRQSVTGGSAMCHQQHGLSGCSVIGTFAYVGTVVDPSLRNQIREQWQQQFPHLATSGQSGTVGITRLSEGIVCRYRGTSTAEARALFMCAWDSLRQALFSLPTQRPRAWSI
jgi:urease accessory protein